MEDVENLLLDWRNLSSNLSMVFLRAVEKYVINSKLLHETRVLINSNV